MNTKQRILLVGIAFLIFCARCPKISRNATNRKQVTPLQGREGIENGKPSI
jgi:hypothetical protein